MHTARLRPSAPRTLIEPVRDRRPATFVPSATQPALREWPWWLAALACVVCVALSAGVWIDARDTQREIPGLQQGLALLRIEREAGVAVGRLGLQAIRLGYDDPTADDLPELRASTAELLTDLRTRLVAMQSLSLWKSTVDRLLETVDEGIRRMEAPGPPPEGIWAWQWAFTTSFSGVFPQDLTGQWSDLLEFTIGTQYGVYVPVSHAELVLAYWAREGGRVAAHPGLRAYIDAEVGRLESLEAQSDSAGSPFDPEFSPERAAQLGDEMAERVAALRDRMPILRIEATQSWILGRAPAPALESLDQLVAQTTQSLDALSGAGEELLRMAEARLSADALAAGRRARASALAGFLIALAGLGVLGWWMGVRRRLEERLRAAAEKDALTGIDSRWALFHHEEPRLMDPDGKGVALLLTDMDDFKSINDRWGHQVGDGALVAFGQACARVVEADDRVARIGGDEFVLVLHDLADPAAEAEAVAERLHASLAAPITIAGVRLYLRATIGIAIAHGPTALDELLLHADTALLDAKKNRRNRHAIYSRNYRRALIREIDEALEKGAIEPVFQPLVRTSDGAVSGAELLARWTREDGTQVPLDALIEAMMSVGASGAWTERMLAAAARLIPALPDTDRRFWLNVAVADLLQPSATVLVASLLDGPVPPGLLGIEVTEPILGVDVPESRTTLQALRQAGVAVALDDVGSGVPLRHLTELPLDRVKIDGSMVRGVDTSAPNRALLRGLITVAHDLGLTVVAEQVETAGEERVLLELGIDYLQGYRIGAPMSLGAFRRLMENEAGLSLATRAR